MSVIKNMFYKKETRRKYGEEYTIEKLVVHRVAAAIAVAIFLVALMVSCQRVVGTGEVAVVTRFGNVVGVESSGFHVKAPIDSYNIIDVTQQQVTDDYSTASRDNQSIDQTITAQISVGADSACDLYRQFLGNHIDGIVKPVLADGFKSANAKFTLEETIEKRDELSEAMLSAVRQRLEPYGINVVSVEINNVSLPEEYKSAVERQKVAERDQVTAQVEKETAEIQAETNKILAESLDSRNFQKMFMEKWNGVLPLYMGGDDALSMMLPTVN